MPDGVGPVRMICAETLMSAPLSDGKDTFIVNQLKSMETARPLVTPDHGITVRRDTLDHRALQ